MYDSLRPHELQHTRPPCPSPTPRVHSNSSSRWCMPSSCLILCRPLLLLPPNPPSIKVFSNESTLRMRWPNYWSFSFSIIPSKEIPGLVSFRMDWLNLWMVVVESRCRDSWPLEEKNLIQGQRQGLITQILCNKVLLKYKGDRESFRHRHQKGAERVPRC